MLQRQWVWYLIIIGLLVIMTGFAFTDPSVRPWLIANKDLPDITFTQFQLKQIDNGAVVLSLNADKATFFRDQSMIRLDMIDGDLFKQSSPYVSFSSLQGQYNINQSLVTLSGESNARLNLKLQSYNVMANHMAFVTDTLQFSAHDAVTLRSNSLTIKGEQLDFDIANEIVTIANQSHATLTVND